MGSFGVLVILAAIIFGTRTTTVRLAGTPRTLEVIEERWPLRARRATFVIAPGDSIGFEPSTGRFWGKAMLVRVHGAREPLFAAPRVSASFAHISDLNAAIHKAQASRPRTRPRTKARRP